MDAVGLVIKTNRDLYVAIGDLIEQRKNTSLTLEAYLSTLWSLGRASSHEPGLSVDTFFQLLSSGFDGPAPAFDESWRSRYAPDHDELAGFDGWETAILRQIVDLREMDKAGTLANEMRYFGVNSPRGGYWYNFDPCSFIECAMAGSFGGWQPGDNTGRDYVPGKVAVMNESGEIESRDPQDIDNPVFAMSSISWDAFREFLWCGQHYE